MLSVERRSDCRLQPLLERDPRDPVAYWHRGDRHLSNAHRTRDEVDLGIRDFDAALRFGSKEVVDRNEPSLGGYDRFVGGAHLYRGKLYLLKGEYERAAADFDQAIALSPQGATGYQERAKAYNGMGEYDRAIADCDEVIRLNPKDPNADAYAIRGAAYLGKGEVDRAIADLDHAIEFEPYHAEAYPDRGLAYARKGDFDRAMADLDRAISSQRTDNAYRNRAAVYEMRGDPDHAIADANVAIRLLPSDSRAYYWRGKAWFDKGEYDRAIADYDEALKFNPKFAEARENRDHARAALAAAPNPGKPGTATPPPASSPALGRRVALVIGNSQYRSAPALPTPRRDAQAVADALRLAGFQSVTLATDLDRDGMARALRSFRDQADSADWALIYFAGHGIEIDGTNYFIPVDAKLADDRDVKDEAVSYESLSNAIAGAKALRILVLDASRSNPFKEHMRRTMASRSPTDRGLAPPPETEPGTLVVYAAQEGAAASDDPDGANSPFARAFVAGIKVPGREVRRLFDYVRDAVLRATDRRQQPFTYGSLPANQDYFFLPAR